MAQTDEVAGRLRAFSPGVEVGVVGVRTQADASPEAALAGMGRGMVVKELEEALLPQGLAHTIAGRPCHWGNLPAGRRAGCAGEPVGMPAGGDAGWGAYWDQQPSEGGATEGPTAGLGSATDPGERGDALGEGAG